MEEKRTEVSSSIRSFFGRKFLSSPIFSAPNKSNNPKHYKLIPLGFTLVELLLVVAILGILVSGFIVVMNPAKQLANSRDAKRKSDLRQIQSALELYRADNGRYPGFGSDPDNPIFGRYYASSINFTNSDGINYMNSIPTPPKTDGDPCKGYFYAITSNFFNYTIFTILENTSDPDATSPKPTPTYTANGSSPDGNRTWKWSAPSCDGPDHIYNYWVINP